MVLISLTQGKTALINKGDRSKILGFKWRYSGNKTKNTEYAVAGIHSLRMHRLIMDCPEDMEVDHINGNGLDNRRKNLRICTRLQNVRNTPKRKDTQSKFKGVHFLKKRDKWIARIQVEGKRINSGYFNTELEAAKRYNELATKYHEEFAYLNPVDKI